MLLSVCLVAAQAQAQREPRQFVDLSQEVDSAMQGCPSATEFRATIANELGYDPYRAGADLRLAVRVRPSAAGIDGSLNWSIGTGNTFGERRFAGKTGDCRQLMASMGFAVAVHLQLMASEPRFTPAAPESSAEASAHGGASPSSDRVDSDANREHLAQLTVRDFQVRSPPRIGDTKWVAMVGAGPALTMGLAPVLVGQGRIFFGVQHGWAGLELGAEAGATSTTLQPYGGGFRHALRVGTLAGCAWQGALAVCGVMKLGRIQVEGTGISMPASPRGFMAQTGPRLAYAFGLGEHLVLLGHVEGLWLLTAWTVNVNHVAVWSMPRLAAIAGIDLAIRFP